MLTSTKNPPNFLIVNNEPEQLDLFGWDPSPESAIVGGAILSTVCDQIASVAGVCYGLSAEKIGQLRAEIIRQCSSEPSSAVLSDYVVGLASTMSFLPTPLQQTFLRSDRAALASDWACVQSDLNLVWHAITTSQRDRERPGQRERRRKAQAAE